MSFLKNSIFGRQSEESPQKVGPKDKEVQLGDTTNQEVKISSARDPEPTKEGLERQNREDRKKDTIKELIQEDLPA